MMSQPCGGRCRTIRTYLKLAGINRAFEAEATTDGGLHGDRQDADANLRTQSSISVTFVLGKRSGNTPSPCSPR